MKIRPVLLLLLYVALLPVHGCGDDGGMSASVAGPSAIDPAAGVSSEANADAAFDTLADQLAQRYFASLPEIATYYGAPPELAPGAAGRLTDRSTTGSRFSISGSSATCSRRCARSIQRR